MLFPIILFLMVLSPLFIPIGVTVFDEFDNWRRRRAWHSNRQFHPAVRLVPAHA